MFLENKVFHIKKKRKGNFLRYTWVYEIFNPETNEQIGIVKDELSGILKILGKLIKKRFLPKHLHIYDIIDDSKVFSIKINTFSSKIIIYDQAGNTVGRLDSKLLGGCYYFVYDNHDREIGQIKGHIMARDFALVSPHEKQIGVITKAWKFAGSVECCMSKDDFIVAVEDPIAHRTEDITMLLLGTGFALDIALTKK